MSDTEWRGEQLRQVGDAAGEVPSTSRHSVAVNLCSPPSPSGKSPAWDLVLGLCPSALSWALAAVTQGQGMSPGDLNGVGLLRSAPPQGPWSGQPPLACCPPLVTHPLGGRSLGPQSPISVDLGMTGTYFPALLLHSPQRPLSGDWILNFPPQEMSGSQPC